MNVDILKDPDIIESLKRIITYEEETEAEHGHALHWTWQEVAVPWQIIRKLLLAGFLEVIGGIHKAYLLKDRQAVKQLIQQAEAMEEEAEERIEVPENLFSPILGYDDVKELIKKSLEGEKPTGFLLVGPVATAKSLFLEELNRIRGSSYHLGSSCYSEDTEVLTANGFKHFYELTYEDEIATLNNDGYLEYQRAQEIQKYEYEGEMIHFQGAYYDFLVTPNHKMYVRSYPSGQDFELRTVRDIVDHLLLLDERQRRYSELYPKAMELRKKGWGAIRIAKELGLPTRTVSNWIYGSKPNKRTRPSAVFEFKRNMKWEGRYIAPFIPLVTGSRYRRVNCTDADVWLRFFGWWLAEGSVAPNQDYRVSFATPHREEQDEIASLIRAFGFSPTRGRAGVAFYSKQICLYLTKFGHAPEKYIPKDLKQLPPDKLSILLHALLRGDGYERDRDSYYFTTASKRLADDVAEIAMKCGYVVTAHQVEDSSSVMGGRSIKASGPMHYVSIYKSKETPVLTTRPKIVPYKGNVYCVTVPNHVILVRRNGKIGWSGNSTKAGLTQFLLEAKPKILLIDEFDKMKREDYAALLSLMESGKVVETKFGRRSEEYMNVWVFASCNNLRGIPPENISRFRPYVFHFREYTVEEFKKVVKMFLVERESVDPNLANYIAEKVSAYTRDVRAARGLARLCRNKEDVDKYVNTILKYQGFT